LTVTWHSIVFFGYSFVLFTCLPWVLICLRAIGLGGFPKTLVNEGLYSYLILVVMFQKCRWTMSPKVLVWNGEWEVTSNGMQKLRTLTGKRSVPKGEGQVENSAQGDHTFTECAHGSCHFNLPCICTYSSSLWWSMLLLITLFKSLCMWEICLSV
jgi:hypothetical protein